MKILNQNILIFLRRIDQNSHSNNPKPLSRILRGGITSSGIPLILNYLEDQGLITKKKNPNRRTTNLVSLTPKGRQIMALLEKLWEDIEKIKEMLPESKYGLI